MTYRAPVAEIAFTLKHGAGLSRTLAQGGELTADDVDAVLEEAGRFATDVLAPLNSVGDKFGTPFKDGAITTPPGWKEAYRDWSAAGWNAVSLPAQWGGQALPHALNAACIEMWNSASMAFGIGPVLTMGAAEALASYGSEELKQRYLPKLVSGEWMGTMQLTEPQAGSDVGALRTKAVRQQDGTYRITGQKIFITYGEHDLTDNIIHFVLARLPDAPAGTRGISLFLVPKFMLNGDGSIGPRNDVRAHSLEHKLGIHASPTCTMVFGDNGGATGFLVGEEHRGMACMFTMMNEARLAVALQGVAVAEAATQQATAYARERRQGHVAGTPAAQGHGGMGYVEETGAAQLFRDARIAQIYEGTNGIQAIDLVTRKLPLAGGAAVGAYLDELRATVAAVTATNHPGFGATGARLGEAVDDLARATAWLREKLGSEPEAALAGATPYLRLFGLAAGGCMLADE